MSVLARRRRDEQFARERELVAMRDAVVRATTSAMPTAGSSATLEAVDEALAQLVSAQAHLAEADQVKATWIKYARCRLLDEHGSADVKRRDTTAVDEHSQALAISVCGDPDDVIEDDRQSWRVREILSVLHGEQRKWAEAWYREVLSVLPAGAQPRGLPDALGWTSAKTEKTAQRARRGMAAFVTRRQSGEICAEQRALLDGFISAGRGGGLSDLLEHERFEAIVFHVVGCDDCFATWHSRRRTLLSRPLAIVMLPVDVIAAAAHGFAAKVAAITATAATSVLGRLGIGGAAAGGGAATIGGKTAAVCVGVVCAATAGGEIAGVVPPLLHDRAPQTREQDAPRKQAQAPAQPASAEPKPAASEVAPPPPPPAAPAAASAQPAAEAPAPPPPPPPAAVTPGDLPAAPTSGSSTPAGATSSASPVTAPPPPPPPPPPASRPPASSGGGSSCVPGSLGC